MLTVLRPRLVPNFTAPATSANRVSSPPRPTPLPGWKCVPRWRTRISPALTTWPPYRLTPSRCALESRPLRVEDAPFLCAIVAALLGLGRSLGRPAARRLARGLLGGLRARQVDGGHLDLRQALAVSLTLAVAGLVLVLEDGDLRALRGRDDLGGDRHVGERRGVARHGV